MDYLGGLSVSTRVFESGGGRERREPERWQLRGIQPDAAAFEDGGGGHKPRNAGSLQKLGKAGKRIHP